MKEFKLSREEWYTARDDRTNKNGLLNFRDFSVGIVVDPVIEFRYSPQIMTLMATNILARWCREIRIQMQDVNSCIPHIKKQKLRNVLLKVMSNADPYGEFTFGKITESEFDRILVIGNLEEELKHPYVWIDGSGWIAGVGYGKDHSVLSRRDDINPIGPAFASCLGTAELFRHAVEPSTAKLYSTWYSLYDFKRGHPDNLTNPCFSSNINFGTIHQVGCGAVGSSLDYLLSLTNWRGYIHLIDDDSVEPSNCNRSLSFSAHDAVEKKRKIKVCASALKYSGFSSIIFDGKYADLIEKKGFLKNPPDLILCLANEDNVWANIQHNYPPIVYHATTTPNWGLNFGRHIPIKEWCILCRFSQELTHRFTPECGKGEIPSQTAVQPVYTVLPFLSPASAILILAEMAKIASSKYPITNNFIDFSMRDPTTDFLIIQRGRKSGCICNEQTIAVYPREIKKGKFWEFSE